MSNQLSPLATHWKCQQKWLVQLFILLSNIPAPKFVMHYVAICCCYLLFSRWCASFPRKKAFQFGANLTAETFWPIVGIDSKLRLGGKWVLSSLNFSKTSNWFVWHWQHLTKWYAGHLTANNSKGSWRIFVFTQNLKLGKYIMSFRMENI